MSGAAEYVSSVLDSMKRMAGRVSCIASQACPKISAMMKSAKAMGMYSTSAAEAVSYALRQFYGWDIILGLQEHSPRLAHTAYHLLYNTGNLAVGYAGAWLGDLVRGISRKVAGEPERVFSYLDETVPLLYGTAATMATEMLLGTRELRDIPAGIVGALMYMAIASADRILSLLPYTGRKGDRPGRRRQVAGRDAGVANEF